MFMIDRSGSIDSPNFNLVKSWVSDIVRDLPMEGENDPVRVGMVTFSTTYKKTFYLNQ